MAVGKQHNGKECAKGMEEEDNANLKVDVRRMHKQRDFAVHTAEEQGANMSVAVINTL